MKAQFLVVLAAAVACSLPLHAEEEETSKPYVSFSLGLARQSDADYNESGTFPFTASSANIQYNSGGVLSLALGSTLAKTPLRLEGELLMIGSEIDQITDRSYRPLYIGGDAASYLLVGMVNVYLDWNNSSMFTPYVMAGGGGGAYGIDFDNYMGDASTGVWAGQLGFGTAIRIDEKVEIEFKFKNIWTTDPKFDIDPWGTAKTEASIQQYLVGVRVYF